MPEEPDGETLRVKVDRVADGDCFIARVPLPNRSVGFRVAVRFGFIDAPEIEQPGGREAREFLSDIISDQWLDLVLLMKMDTGRIVDAYRRLVAVPYLRQERRDGDQTCRNVELEMVLNGWAWVLDRYEPDARYFDALEDARRQRRGIWALSENIHPWEFKRQRYWKSRQANRQGQLPLSG